MTQQRALTHEDFSKVFRALADDTRRQVLATLVNHELSVLEVAERMQDRASVSVVSRHLAVLREAGIVQEEPGTDGRYLYKMQHASKYEIERAFGALLALWKR